MYVKTFVRCAGLVLAVQVGARTLPGALAGQEARFAEAKVVTANAGQAGLWLKVPGPGMVLILR